MPPVPDARPFDVAWPELRWPISPGVELAGRWITVRTLHPSDDADSLYAALEHDAVWAHLGERPATPQQLARTLQHRRDVRGWHQWLVVAHRDIGSNPAGAVVGTSSYLEISPPDARLEIGSTAYTPAVWATVVNAEAKLLLLGHAFDELGAGRVQLKTDVRNVRSQRAIAALGATFEGTLRRYQRRADGTVRDTVLFSIIAEDWPTVRSRLVDRVDRWSS